MNKRKFTKEELIAMEKAQYEEEVAVNWTEVFGLEDSNEDPL